MHTRLPPTPPRVGLHIRSQSYPALPLHLAGHEASVVVQSDARVDDRGHLRLDWDDGTHTKLDVRVRTVDPTGPTTGLEVFSVGGDWRPFLEYVAHTTN
jgi:hypothetical protein